MPLFLKDVSADNCGGFISAPDSLEIHVDGLRVTNTRQVFDMRDPPSVMQQLGFPPDTPPKAVAEALSEALILLERVRREPVEQQKAALRETALAKMLGVAADATTLYANLTSPQGQGVVTAIIRALGG